MLQSSTSASTGGYNFNSPSSTPAVAFDPNSRPSFNFTKGSAPAIFKYVFSLKFSRASRKNVVL